MPENVTLRAVVVLSLTRNLTIAAILIRILTYIRINITQAQAKCHCR